jgi:uncharacterized repeat protein (TIGR02543 family)
MKRFQMKGIGLLLLVMLAAAALIGCDMIDTGGGITDDPPEEQEERGSLTVSLSDEINSRTLEPAISMDAASFTIEGDGPGDQTFTPVIIDDPTITSYEIDDLLAGVWTITVTAKNEENTVIGQGTKTTTITAGDNTVSIDVLPLPGDGEFELTISWPVGTITDPGFDATLTRIVSDDTQTLNISVESGASQTVYTDTSIAAGYYSLNVIPKTGEDVINGSGFTEAVRIVEGEKTQGLYELTPVGDAVITWDTNLQNPYIVDIERTANSAIFTASVDPVADDYTYSWSLNGVEIDGETNSTVTLSDGFVAGSNTLNAIIQKDGIASSAREIFDAYTISFDANGGSAETDQVVLDGMTATEPTPVPTKDGYVFEDWYADSGLTTAYDFTAAVTENISLYAKWTELTSYTVTFDSNGGSAVDPQTVYENDSASKPADPTKENYTFAGWYTEAELTTEFDFATAVTGDLTLYAKWEVPQDTLILTLTPTDQSDTTVLEYVLTSGPAYSSESTGDWGDVGLNITSTEGAPTVAFGIGYYSGSDTQDSGFFASDTPFCYPGNNNQTEPIDSTLEDYVSFETLIIGTGSDSVTGAYATGFKLVDTKGSTVTWFYDSTSDGPTVIFSSTAAEGEYVTGTITGTISMEVNTEGSESSVITEDAYTVEGSFNVLNSEMNDSYTLAYDMNNEDPVFMELVFDGNAAMGPWSTPEKDGYKFGGWYTDSTLTTPFDMESVVTADMNLYAKWDPYAVGEAGPAGGVIFYVDSDDIYSGWTCLEVAPEELPNDGSGVNWDDGNTNYNGTDAPLLPDDIGMGLENTQTIMANSSDIGAAQLCDNYGYDNEGEYYDDWFLPSKNELVELFTFFSGLTETEQNNFSPNGYLYWSSSGSVDPYFPDPDTPVDQAFILTLRDFSASGYSFTAGTIFNMFPNFASQTPEPESIPVFARPVRRF